MKFTNDFILIVKEIKNDNVPRHDYAMNYFYRECSRYAEVLSKVNNFQFDGAWTREDYMQDVCSKILEKISGYDENRPFECYFNTIAKNLYRKEYNKKNNCRVEIQDMYYKDEDGKENNRIDAHKIYSSTEENFVKNESWNQVFKVVKTYPKNYQQVFKLCNVYGLKSSEAAKILNCSARDVYNWKNRVNKKLQEYINVNNIYEELQRSEYTYVA